MTTEREELAAIISAPRMHTNMSGDKHRATADAILAAGYRKPRTITTIEELNALPDESIVRTRHGDILELDEDRTGEWRNGYRPGWDIGFIASEHDLPATLLWSPDE